jgi:hypothetical protein
MKHGDGSRASFFSEEAVGLHSVCFTVECLNIYSIFNKGGHENGVPNRAFGF